MALFSHVSQTKQGHHRRLFLRHPLWNRHHRKRREDAGAGSISRATALNSPSPTALQRTDPTKSAVSAPGNAASMSQAVCPLASRGMLAPSSSTPSRIKSQRTNPALDSRLWSATSVVIPPSWREERGASCGSRWRPSSAGIVTTGSRSTTTPSSTSASGRSRRRSRKRLRGRNLHCRGLPNYIRDFPDLILSAVVNVYIAGAGNHRIRKVDLTGTITTITDISRLQACQVLSRRVPPADTSKHQHQCHAQNGEDVPNCRVILWPK